jgi:Small metal-binding protein
MIKLKSIVLAGVLAFLSSSMALAHQDKLKEAIAHTREAVVAGRTNQPSLLVRHSTEALYSAREAYQDHPNAHIKKGIARLKEAIKFGNKRRSSATTIAYRALQELERAPH